MDTTEWIRCPVCRNKTRVQIRKDTGIEKLSPLLSKVQAGKFD